MPKDCSGQFKTISWLKNIVLLFNYVSALFNCLICHHMIQYILINCHKWLNGLSIRLHVCLCICVSMFYYILYNMYSNHMDFQNSVLARFWPSSAT